MAGSAADERPEIQFHDGIAHKWETLHRGRVFRQRTAAMFKLLDGADLTHQIWVDAGCGTGTLSRRLAERGCSVMGFDASEEMLVVARRPTVHEPSKSVTAPSFQLIKTIEHLPMPQRSCDGVLCASVLEYTSAPERCLTEFSRVLRPGGLLLLSIPNRPSLPRRLFKIAYAISSRLLPRPAFRYLQHSVFELSIRSATELLYKHGFIVLGHNFAGSSFPAVLDRTSLVGTLINIVARRDAADPISKPPF